MKAGPMYASYLRQYRKSTVLVDEEQFNGRGDDASSTPLQFSPTSSSAMTNTVALPSTSVQEPDTTSSPRAVKEGDTSDEPAAVGDEKEDVTTTTITTSSPALPLLPVHQPQTTTTTILLEPSRVEGNSTTTRLGLHPAVPLASHSALPPSPHRGRLPPVAAASASHVQTVFDSNNDVFTITSTTKNKNNNNSSFGVWGGVRASSSGKARELGFSNNASSSSCSRPQSSVISQQPLAILPVGSSSNKHNNNNNMESGEQASKYDRVTLSSSGSEKSRTSDDSTVGLNYQRRHLDQQRPGRPVCSSVLIIIIIK